MKVCEGSENKCAVRECGGVRSVSVCELLGLDSNGGVGYGWVKG